jgi:hypothetical protein|tara:strand:+ start:307 stop:573 length:267 start_codon:yes stop_codon:yes gene_type:complete
VDSAAKAKWLKTRELGYLRFVLQYGVVYWGVPMFLFMTFIVFRLFENRFSFGLLSIHVQIWVVAGAAFGISNWSHSEKKTYEHWTSRR